MTKKSKLKVYEVTPERLSGETKLILAENFEEAVKKTRELMAADKELRNDDIGQIELTGSIDA